MLELGLAIAPSLVAGGLSLLGGMGKASFDKSLMTQQLNAQGKIAEGNQRVALFNNVSDYALQTYLAEKDAVKAKRLRNSIISAFQNRIMMTGGRGLMPAVGDATPPSPVKNAQDANAISRLLGVWEQTNQRVIPQ